MKREHLILLAIVAVGIFLRFYRLDDQYIRFNDTFFRLTPALELSKGIIPSSYGQMPGISFLFAPVMLVKSSVMAAQVVVALFGAALIPLSYYLVRKVSPKSEMAPLLLAFFVAINPSFVALSKVVMWDIVVLFFLVLAIITTIKTARERNFGFALVHFILLFYLVFLKAPNLIFFPLSLGYILYYRIDSIKNIKSIKKEKFFDVFLGTLIFLSLFAIYLYFFPATKSSYVSGGGTGFFVSSFYRQNFLATIRILIVTLNTPPTNMYFALQSFSENYFILYLLATFQILVAILGISELKDKKQIVFLLSVFFSFAMFYFFFKGWAARYICISVFVMLLFLCLGVEYIVNNIKLKFFKKSVFSLCLTIGIVISLIFSASTIYTLEDEWGTQRSLNDNYIEIDYMDAQYTLEKATEEGVSLIVSPYGQWFEFYKIADNIDIEILNLFKIRSEEDLINTIDENLKSDNKVWYVKGWPEEYGWGNIPNYYNIVMENYNLEEIYKGKMYFKNKGGNPENSFIVSFINKRNDS